MGENEQIATDFLARDVQSTLYEAALLFDDGAFLSG
jgi:hypothetical protein